MGTDVHGPWIEIDCTDDRYSYGRGVGSWRCLAQLEWRRDYLLFDILSGMRHGEQKYTIKPASGLPEDLSYQWHRHAYVMDPETRTWHHPYSEEASRLVPYSSHFGFSTLTLSELLKARELYAKVTLDWRAENQAELDKLEVARSAGGLVVAPYMATTPTECDDLELAILIMSWAEKTLGTQTRVSMCFDN